MTQTVFMSYGAPDEAFAIKLSNALRAAGIETFIFVRDASPGEKLHHLLRDKISEHDRVILVCSKNSLNRSGVQNEIEETLQREAREGGASILIPITLDDYIFTQWRPFRHGLAQSVRDRVIADFRQTNRSSKRFDNAVSRLVNVLLEDSALVYLEFKSEISILDRYGKKANWMVTRSLFANRPGVTQIPYREIVGSGKIRYVSAKPGRIERYVEGGAECIRLRLSKPLRRGKIIESTIHMQAIDCFLQKTEDFIFRAQNSYRQVDFVVHFPKVRPVRRAMWSISFGDRKIGNGALEIIDNGRTIHMAESQPRPGAYFRIEWEW